ncbi:hypothetical protein ACFWOL_32925, partial [Streptomyces sp. NPDC058442]
SCPVGREAARNRARPWRAPHRAADPTAWLAGCRRLHRRYERKADHFLAFTSIACTLICYRRLTK